MTPKGYRVTSIKIPSSDAIISWSEKTALFGVTPLIFTAIPQQLSFEPGYVIQVGLTSPLEFVLIL